ncbi:MAG: hypothetical protein ACK41D_09810 [Rubricoccaceae bacterium]
MLPSDRRAETPAAEAAPRDEAGSPEALRARDEVYLALELVASANARASRVVAEEVSEAALLAVAAAAGRLVP